MIAQALPDTGALASSINDTVGMAGRAYAGGHDPHDGAFSAIGIHGF